jgi:outer membrane protein
MKSNNLVTGLLAIAIAGLYILHFTRSSGQAENKNSNLASSEGQQTVYFVYADSILENFEMMQDLEAEFVADNQTREQKLMQSKNSIERKIKDYERQLPTMTTRERERAQEDVQRLQQEFFQDQNELSQLAAMQEAEMVTRVYDSLGVFFKQIGEELKADYILATQKASGVLYADSKWNITSRALEQINERYRKGKTTQTN